MSSARDAILETLRAVLATAPHDVVAAYLYGSQARGSARAQSDVDIAVLLARRPEPRLLSTARALESTVEAVLRRPVQVVVLNSAPSDLVHRVLRDGVVVLDRDRPARLRFEVQARNEYFDMEPIRRLYRRMPA
ncbi:MAG TPA: nucleotidyltransferase domain-containing protein [Vicinamibacteria bacterium]|nr:nucleotidyltransferase domain-containing protein [Vicinamibacteria bacterium]